MIEIPLTKGYVAVIDDEDGHLAGFRWRAHEHRRPDGTVRAVYAIREIRRPDRRRTTQRLHQAVMSAPPGTEIDHIDHDGLNCRRSNLRLATGTQNHANQRISAANTTGFKGVSARNGRWRAQIKVRGAKRHIGVYDTPEAAARAYDAAARREFGEFALVNFPEAP